MSDHRALVAGIAKDLAQALGPAEPASPTGPLHRFFGGSKWNGGLSRSGRTFRINHAETIRNARAVMMESLQARAVVERTADTVADGGLRREFDPDVEILGITREQAAKWARNVEARFHLFAGDVRQHRSELIPWYQTHGLYQLFRHRDNDIFIRLFYDDNPTLQSPLQFEFIDPELIRGSAYTSTGGWNQPVYRSDVPDYSSDGILRDERGRETGYKVWVAKPDGTLDQVTLPAVYEGGLPAMIHCFRSEYAGQGRGFARLAHAIQELENLTDFSASVIKKAINQASIFAFVEPSKTEDANNPFEGILSNQGAGPAAQLFGSNPQQVDGVPVSPELYPRIENCYQVPEASVDTPGSLFVATLTKGQSIKFPQMSAPADSYDKFVDAFMDYLSASCSIPREVVLMKFGQNYSASRATLLLFFRVVAKERAEMADDYLNRVVEAWLSCEIAAGRISAPGWSDPRMRKAWMNGNWIGSGEPDIDPAKSAKARRDNLELGVTNVEREARNLNGSSAASNIATNNKVFSSYRPLPWNEPGNPPQVTAAPKPAAVALLDEIRAIVREELDDAGV